MRTHTQCHSQKVRAALQCYFDKTGFEMITRIHANLDESHGKVFLLLSTIVEQNHTTRLAAFENKRTLKKNLQSRLMKLKLRHILALE